MFKKFLTPILALSLALLSSTAQAFWDPPFFTPASPSAGETVSINIRTGICDAIFNRDSFPRITQVGNTIHVVVYGVHWEPGELRTYPPASGGLPIGE